ncbi:SNF1-related protein kinase regulatory subunit beta-1 like [Actinidia chinensis var. chinensis]|uniref:SNF1-related protein kinase regulatory subunit beta-1 like n=1 Tax=Actinidia chinensis var. chinensis TaxID=1590841 RepID=A0A2R6PG09_ACTCC|nr:SNF1-related protein kinase regulatory subunit beta-1 like [Actinidia chinensis var. chinensis]
MGNANGREDAADGGVADDVSGRSNGDLSFRVNHAPSTHPPSERVASSDWMANSPPDSPGRSGSPLMFAPQVPVALLLRKEGPPFVNQMRQNEPPGAVDLPAEQGIPTLITWNHGGNDVAVEGSWDSWTSRKMLQRSGKDHSILLVLPSGIYHYKFIVDGEQRYIPDLPFVADETGHVCNLLDVHDYVPENFESVEEFEAPPSPDSSYSDGFLREEDFAKDPVMVPSQLHLTVVGMQNPHVPPPSSSSSPSSPRPQHVVLNHLFIEKGWASQSVVALGLTHRFQSKYVTVVLYKPLKR